MKEEIKREQLGGFWLRVIAYVLDILIITTVTGAVNLIITGQKGSVWTLFSIGSASTIIDWVNIVLFWGYNVAMVGIFGATIGKMALGLKVVQADLEKPDWLTVIVREIVGKTISLILLGFGFLMVIWDDKRQGLHDKIAETIVIKEHKMTKEAG